MPVGGRITLSLVAFPLQLRMKKFLFVFITAAIFGLLALRADGNKPDRSSKK
jgi:hypothetical protein